MSTLQNANAAAFIKQTIKMMIGFPVIKEMQVKRRGSKMLTSSPTIDTVCKTDPRIKGRNKELFLIAKAQPDKIPASQKKHRQILLLYRKKRCLLNNA